MTDPRLTIDLVPENWWENLRANIEKKEWDYLRKQAYEQFKYRCAVCNGIGEDIPVLAAEEWEYDSQNKIQKLLGLIALCPRCYEVKHMCQHVDNFELCINHISLINSWDMITTLEYVSQRKEENKTFQRENWKTDLSMIDIMLADYYSELTELWF